MEKEYNKARITWLKTLHGGPRSVLDEALIWDDNIEAIIYRFYIAGYSKEVVIALFQRIVKKEYEDIKACNDSEFFNGEEK